MREIIKYMKWIVGMIIYLSSAFLCAAQHSELAFKRFTTDDGLSQITILALHQDENGFLWIATKNGLNVFDGYEFKHFFHDPWDSTTLSHNHIEAIEPGLDNQLWVGTNNGLCRLDLETETFKRYSISSDTDEDWQVVDVEMDQEGNVWVASRNGLFLKPQGKEKLLQISPDTVSGEYKDVFRVYTGRNGRVFMGGRDGLYMVQKVNSAYGLVEIPLEDEGVQASYIQSFHQTDDSTLWIGSLSRLWHYEIESGKIESFDHAYMDENDQKLSFDCKLILNGVDGNLWLNGYSGAFVFDPIKKQFVDRIHHETGNPFSLSDNSIHSALATKEGGLWIGTYSGGLNYYSPYLKSFELHKHAPQKRSSLNSNILNDFVEGPDGKIYIGSSRGGLNVWDVENDQYEHHITDLNIRHMLLDEEGILWMGTLFNGVVKYDTKNQTFFHYLNEKPEALEGMTLTTGAALIKDQKGDLWAANWNAFYHYDTERDTFERYAYEIGPTWKDRTIRSVLRIGNQLWMGSMDGIHVFDTETRRFVKWYRHDSKDRASLPNDVVTSMIQDDFGTIWVATYGGLSHFNPQSDTFTNYDIKDGLPSNMVLCLLIDEENKVWLSTSNGLAKFDPHTRSIKVFDESNNLQSSTFRAGACYACQSGEFLFGGINGFNKFDPLDLVEDTTSLKAVLTDLYLFNKKIEPGKNAVIKKKLQYLDTLVLQHDQNVLSIGFTAADFFDQGKTRFAYRMKGFDEKWNKVGNNRMATYTNLSPGYYMFEVLVANANLPYYEKSTNIILKIVPPFWATTWFRVLVAVLLVLLVISIHSFRVESLVKQGKKMDLLVKERTAIIDQQNQKLMEQNLTLQQAEEEVRTANELLQVANSNLEFQVAKRTEKLDRHMNQLKEYAFLNSHKVRSPLVRILGLVGLYKSGKLSQKELNEINKHIEESAYELDEITRKINEELDDPKT
ncbi:ligand-binding sensor domain-containing protein [Reichenbachiella ulvae]|uniref:Two component regulator three Y domain-containing protein n=1 Tax=Reichenbachiella ulvae TaxID=2980104 RepID=A0ABT3CP63_9BACT|nr:hybrid sensor histidine kinase/response regulator [Reichenbachiella ulvae]MCV9385387.1 hypothetical protein [Reichenbachiella ulvae]